MSGARILLVEDNADLAEGMRYNLAREGYAVRVASDGHEGLELATRWPPDLVLLDLMLPGRTGFEVLEALRAGGSQVPVIIVSARGEEGDKVRGFRLDADQYVTKPVGLLELLERVRALLRRRGGSAGDVSVAPIRFGRVVVDPARRTVTVDGELAALTPKAYELLLALLRREGAVATRVALLKEVWGSAGDVQTRTVDSHMAELRRKLERDPATPEHFLTVWKVGYRFQP
ncbi:MAG: response regulator transcription factor [Gemmatimonadales bacterium]